MFSKNYRKEKSNQRNQIISKYARKTVKEISSLHLKKQKIWFDARRWMRDEVNEERQIIMTDMFNDVQFYPDLWNTGFLEFLELYNWFLQFTWEKCYHLPGFFELQVFESPDFPKRLFRFICLIPLIFWTLRKKAWLFSHFYSNVNIVTTDVIYGQRDFIILFKLSKAFHALHEHF